MKKNFYITTTLPYVNSDPHVGFATELVRADIIARYRMEQGDEVFFNTGTDEHGQKLFDAAKKEGKEIQDYVDVYAQKFKGLKEVLGISDDVHFIRTTDEIHVKAAQAFWKRCDERGFIYKARYQTKYCVGCELEKTDSDLVNGKCPLHPDREIELLDEENYFFKFSAFKEKLEAFYEAHPDFVVPASRFNEIKSFVKAGLKDFSISRVKHKMAWGVPVPGDDDHVMYVWFDALVSYISTLGWPADEKSFEQYWAQGTPTQYCGKDNLRQQSAMWQAMLMAADLPNSHQIIIDGFITGEGGIKMSKSIGNVINPYAVVEEYGVDALRYFIARELSAFEDSPFTMERFKEAYNGNLANGLGNLTSRILKMAETNLDAPVQIEKSELSAEWHHALDAFEINKATDIVWTLIGELDSLIQETQPFKLVKTDKEQGVSIITQLVVSLQTIAEMLNPILPDTANKIKELIKNNKSPEKPLFVRKD